MVVCKKCLMAIEAHEGKQIHKHLSYEDDIPRNEDNSITCDWCEDDCDESEMVII